MNHENLDLSKDDDLNNETELSHKDREEWPRDLTMLNTDVKGGLKSYDLIKLTL